MSEELELRLLREIEQLKKEIRYLKGEDISGIPSYTFSQIKERELYQIVNIEKELSRDKFLDWFNFEYEFSDNILQFLVNLIDKNSYFMRDYNEEDLKINFITPILNKVDFKLIDNKTRDFYNENLYYKSDTFILSGVCDFYISKGLFKPQKPYFFIQEFKKGKENSDPEPQLLAELICGVELNNWNKIKGAYIVGAIWNFVILERIERHRYNYYISQNFDSTKIEDLKGIYKNLVFIKDEIIKITKIEELK